MSNPKKPLNEVHMFSDLSLTARRIISQLLERNEKLQQENQLLKDKTKESLNDNIRSQSRSETLRETNNNSKPHKRISTIAKITKKLGVDSADLSNSIARVIEKMRIRNLGKLFDMAVISTAISKTVSLFTSPLVAISMVYFLDLTTQGYWYTFNTCLAIANYAELGMGQVIMQFSAHELGCLESGKDKIYHEARLKSIFKITVIGGGIVSVIVAVLSFIIGNLILSSDQNSSYKVSWFFPLFFASFISAANMFMGYLNSFLEGYQLYVSTNLRRTFQNMASTISLLLVMSFRGGLWAIPISQFASFIVGITWIFIQNKQLIINMFEHISKNNQVSWQKEIWPLQWRYAATWITGIASFQISNPIIFSTIGAEAAGQFGFTSSLLSVILGYSHIWMSARLPFFSKLVAEKNLNKLREAYILSFMSCIATYFLISTFAIGALLIMEYFSMPFANRLLDKTSIFILLFSQALYIINLNMAYFTRSFKEEPFFKVALLSGILSAILIPICISIFQVRGAVLASLITNILSLPLATKIFLDYYKKKST